ncbi:MAG: helix-turn-helix transcriptional regulator [Bacteroidales bacterium]|nr:helix-turn-helix transcriptional regulator [Bacteroidales bacterium]
MNKTNTRLTPEEIQKLRNTDFSKKEGFVKATEVLEKESGKIGSPERNEFDAKARAWYYGEILRDRRKALGMTQKELAEKVGRERTYINRIEKGETDLQLSSFIRIADALGITLHLEISIA